MTCKEINLKKDNGQNISCLCFIADENKKKSTIIFSHGFGSNYKELQHHGNGFAEAGINCIFFDFCGGGPKSKSDGSLQEMTVMSEIEDLIFVLNQVKNFDYVDSNKIFLQGESMGGLVSAYVAAMNTELVKGLILWYPAFVIPDDSKKRYEKNDNTCFGLMLSPKFNEVAMNIDIFNIIGKFKGPVKIIHGTCDNIVPIEYSKRAVNIYNNATLTVIDNAGHGFEGRDSDYARECSLYFIKSISEVKIERD